MSWVDIIQLVGATTGFGYLIYLLWDDWNGERHEYNSNSAHGNGSFD